MVGGMAATTAYTLWRQRADAIDSGLRIAAMYARSFEDFLTQSLYLTEVVAANTVPMYNWTRNLRSVEHAFVATIRQAPFVRSMSLLDDGDRIVASSNPANVGIQVTTQGYLPPGTGTQSPLRIGQPWTGRDFAGGRPVTVRTTAEGGASGFIPITRTLQVGERSMKLLVALNPDYFINNLLQKLDAREGSVEVMRYDGMLLMSTNPDEVLGALHESVVRDRRFAETESGAFEQDYGNDRHVLTAFRSSRLYPFVVVTHIDREHALRQWRTQAKTLVAFGVPALLTIALLAVASYRRRSQLAAQRAENRRLQRINATVFESSPEATLITDLDANIISTNRAFTHVTGFGPEEVIGRQLFELLTPDGIAAFIKQSLPSSNAEPDGRRNGSAPIEVQQRCKDGTLIWMEVLSTPEHDRDGRIVGSHRICRNITERKQMEDQVRQLAFYDSLTDLPNRRLLNDRLNQALAASRRSGCHGALMFLDLDNFKPLNDTHGHGVGDLLLIAAAARLKSCVRQMDTVARFGGDEFVVMLRELNADKAESISQARIVAEKIRGALSKPYLLTVKHEGAADGTVEHQCTASIGVALFIHGEASQDDLLKWADTAMYEAKEAGRNLIRFHDPGMRVAA